VTVTRLLRGQDYIPLIEGGEQGFVTRFAPSPTGYLHIGHAYAALFAFEAAQRSNGSFLLRIEDIDRQRCRPDFEAAILEDLRWLGLLWADPVMRQSDRLAIYGDAIGRLREMGVAYPCFCSRKQIRIEVEEAGRAPHGAGAEPSYPGTCRLIEPGERNYRIEHGEPFAWRLDVERARRLTGPLWWHDIRGGWIEADPTSVGDVVLGRKDTPTSYHLAVVIDDAAQHVTLVTRGEDLFHATHVHRLLQALLGLPSPSYYHHNIVADSTGQRLAKRNRAVTLRHLRDCRRQPDDIWRMIGLAPRAGALELQ
jgi:glutamyl-Q tRNA(Asp) synthetase